VACLNLEPKLGGFDAIDREAKKLARRIDKRVQRIIKNGGDDEDLLVSMSDYMDTFKQLLDSSTSQEMNELCQRYDGFYRFAKLLEKLAEGIANGTIPVSRSGMRG
jgi:hypothetical protein